MQKSQEIPEYHIAYGVQWANKPLRKQSSLSHFYNNTMIFLIFQATTSIVCNPSELEHLVSVCLVLYGQCLCLVVCKALISSGQELEMFSQSRLVCLAKHWLVPSPCQEAKHWLVGVSSIGNILLVCFISTWLVSGDIHQSGVTKQLKVTWMVMLWVGMYFRYFTPTIIYILYIAINCYKCSKFQQFSD